ncbi:hypothetical protein AB685_24360 [Bacillus sp. LL01]|uniref:molybdate ABC transporter substrate-binding protein n=1 Tax=Bacillus sp. LL01 TaxID=1665556 RepID=UPI00064D4BA9|nr:molybdate ABC transporter substrate-binding protein [Bacillus sp. LL01]KMJ55984.1 hypothetical protein AB685_24360 [Bacillus sp. LL01]
MKQSLTVLIFLALFSVIGCANEEEATKTIYVAAASDLDHALTEIGEEFAKETNVDVVFTFGSTGLLTQQIQEGAPFDLFAAAHESYIDQLNESGAIVLDSKQVYAIGRNVLVYSEGDTQLEGEQSLTDPDIQTIAIANPEHAPYGKAAKETLESWGVWEELQDKLVYAENIRQAYQYVESGNADAGIVALALMNESELRYDLIDEKTHNQIVQALAIPSTSENLELSQQFAEYMVSKKGREILSEYGFEAP